MPFVPCARVREALAVAEVAMVVAVDTAVEAEATWVAVEAVVTWAAEEAVDEEALAAEAAEDFGDVAVDGATEDVVVTKCGRNVCLVGTKQSCSLTHIFLLILLHGSCSH